MKNLIIASTSTVHGSGFLEYLKDELLIHFKNTNEILFVPYARPSGISHEQYTSKTNTFFESIGKSVVGLHKYDNPQKAIADAKGIFIGGGNTFLLVKMLYKNDVILSLKQAINQGTPYLGTSAGSNICGLTMNTTNDMPIIYPPSFNTLAVVPFNINPHYLDTDLTSTHMGETRETRIKEFHKFNTQPVVGIREGSYIDVKGDQLTLKGKDSARIFTHNNDPYEIDTNSSLSTIK